LLSLPYQLHFSLGASCSARHRSRSPCSSCMLLVDLVCNTEGGFVYQRRNIHLARQMYNWKYPNLQKLAMLHIILWSLTGKMHQMWLMLQLVIRSEMIVSCALYISYRQLLWIKNGMKCTSMHVQIQEFTVLIIFSSIHTLVMCMGNSLYCVLQYYIALLCTDVCNVSVALELFTR